MAGPTYNGWILYANRILGRAVNATPAELDAILKRVWEIERIRGVNLV